MDATDREKEIQQNLTDNTAEDILDDQFISTFSSPILDHPRYTLTKDQKVEKYYTADQMIEMFRAGFLSMSRNSFDQKIFEKRASRTHSPYHIMKQMKVGSIHVFPYVKWNAVRCAASTFKRRFGCEFYVWKNSPHNIIGDIKVKRIK